LCLTIFTPLLSISSQPLTAMVDTYSLLRLLTSPIVAITSLRGDEENGMIANSAARASLSPDKPRVSMYVHKFNYSHDMIFDSGRFVLHILGTEDLETVYALGFRSLKHGTKLGAVPSRPGELGLPVLTNCFCYFECEVVNVMDTGGSTLFLGAVRNAGKGNRESVLTPEVLREAMPEERKRQYLENLARAQRFASERADDVQPVVWRGLQR